MKTYAEKCYEKTAEIKEEIIEYFNHQHTTRGARSFLTRKLDGLVFDILTQMEPK